jgi:hypothetical protein
MSVWLVSSPVENLELDAQGRGDLSFTVVNAGPAPEQVTFDVMAGPGADRSWFEVVGPPRLVVNQGAAVGFTVRCATPAGTAAGQYSVQGVAYPAGRPADAALSNPVTVWLGHPSAAGAGAGGAGASTQLMPALSGAAVARVGGPPVGETGRTGSASGSTVTSVGTAHPGMANGTQPGGPATPTGPGPGGPAQPGVATAPPAPGKPKRRGRVLIAVAAALVVILALAAAGFFFLRGNDDGQGDVAAPPPPPAEVVVPDVTQLPQQQATAILEVSNLTVGEIVTVRQRNRQDGTVVDQSIRQGVTPAGS